MFKYLSLTAAILFSGIAGLSQVRIGVKFGFTSPNISYTQPDGVKISKSKTSVLAGAFVSVPLTKEIELRPGMEFTGGFANVNYYFGNDYSTYTEDHTYLDIPVYILYTPQTKNGKFLLGAGPAMKNMLSSSSQDFRAVDWAFNAMAGYEIPIGFSFNVNYQKSLTEINMDRSHSSRHYFGLTVGYLF